MHSSETIKLKYTMTGGNFVDKLSGRKKPKQAGTGREMNNHKNELCVAHCERAAFS